MIRAIIGNNYFKISAEFSDLKWMANPKIGAKKSGETLLTVNPRYT
jgi:hypothetical protein